MASTIMTRCSIAKPFRAPKTPFFGARGPTNFLTRDVKAREFLSKHRNESGSSGSASLTGFYGVSTTGSHAPRHPRKTVHAPRILQGPVTVHAFFLVTCEILVLLALEEVVESRSEFLEVE